MLADVCRGSKTKLPLTRAAVGVDKKSFRWATGLVLTEQDAAAAAAAGGNEDDMGLN